MGRSPWRRRGSEIEGSEALELGFGRVATSPGCVARGLENFSGGVG